MRERWDSRRCFQHHITLQTGHIGVNDSRAAILRNAMIPWRYIYFLASPWQVGTRSTRNGISGGWGVNSAFYGVWKSGMIAGCNHTGTPETPTTSLAFG